MEIRELQRIEVVVGFVCDACGKECYKDSEERHSTEHATFSARWGYWSDDKDMDIWESHLCEACAVKVRDYIEKQLGGKVRVIEECRHAVRLGYKEDRDYIVKDTNAK